MEEGVSNKGAFPLGLSLAWASCLALVGALLLLGGIHWEDARATVPAPGLAVGMGFISVIVCSVLLAIAIGVALVVKEKPTRRTALSWLAAIAISVLALAVYSLPSFPALGFYLLMMVPVFLLIKMRPPPQKERRS